MKTCEVEWCACLPVKKSTFCAAHATNPSLKPLELEDDEELVMPGARCPGCNADGVCRACKGAGSKECECSCGNIHDDDCHACKGTGQCRVCKGVGVQEVRKKPEAA